MLELGHFPVSCQITGVMPAHVFNRVQEFKPLPHWNICFTTLTSYSCPGIGRCAHFVSLYVSLTCLWGNKHKVYLCCDPTDRKMLDPSGVLILSGFRLVQCFLPRVSGHTKFQRPVLLWQHENFSTIWTAFGQILTSHPLSSDFQSVQFPSSLIRIPLTFVLNSAQQECPWAHGSQLERN